VGLARVKRRTWYRVRVGRLSDRYEAKALQVALKMKERYTQAYLTSH